jgi:hypothetical protein
VPQSLRTVRRSALAFSLVGLLAVSAGCTGGDPEPGASKAGTGSTSSTTAKPPAEADYVDGVFRSEVGGFSVALPSAPRRIARQEPLRDLTLDVVIYDVAVSDAEAYQVTYVDYPEALGPLDPPAVLDGAVEGLVSRVSGTLEGRTDLTYVGRAAVDADVRAGFDIHVRAFLVGRRLYTLQRIGGDARSEIYQEMLDTFALR